MKKYIYVGVDQTGAVDSKGHPKPLPSCFIKGNSVFFFYLPKFSKEEISEAIGLGKNEEILICVDCVLGLPKDIKPSWRSLIKDLKKNKGFGLSVARDYFHRLGEGKVFWRQVEKDCKAQSLFKDKPFQKNIQSGTYRIWKEISDHENDFFAPAVEARRKISSIQIFEGYPSLSWKILLGLASRQPLLLSKILKEKYPNIGWSLKHQRIVNKDPNFADAFVLALTMKKFIKEAFLMKPNVEGNILGFKSIDL